MTKDFSCLGSSEDTSMREYIITLKNHTDSDGFYADMETEGGSITIPNRACECCKRRTISRNTHYHLTYEEARQVLDDDRVLAVSLTVRELGLTPITHSWEMTNATFSKKTSSDEDDLNWGFVTSSSPTKITGWTGGIPNHLPEYTTSVLSAYSGKNVDVLIADDGAPFPSTLEFQKNSDGTGYTRLIQYNWYQHNAELGLGANGTYKYDVGENNNTSNFSRMQEHGAHTMGTSAGNTHGWARDANLYFISFYDDNFMDYVRAWHNSKPINPETGVRNPTVMNNSWGYNGTAFNSSRTSSITYRGQTYSPISGNAATGTAVWDSTLINNYWCTVALYRDAATDADFQDAVNDGIVVIASAGNSNSFIDIPSGPDYNNSHVAYTDTGQGPYTYSAHKGSSPAAVPSVISVGAAGSHNENPGQSVYDATFVEDDYYRAEFSNFGPGVDTWAAGAGVQSVWNTDGSLYDTASATDPRVAALGGLSHTGFYNNFKKCPGTSMSGPQVCGILACIAEAYPRMTNADALKFLQKKPIQTMDWTTGGRNDPADLGYSKSVLSETGYIGQWNPRYADPSLGRTQPFSLPGSPGVTPFRPDTGTVFPRSNRFYSKNTLSPSYALSSNVSTPSMYTAIGLESYTSTHNAPILFTQALDDDAGGGNQATWLQDYVNAIDAIPGNATTTLTTVPTGGHAAFTSNSTLQTAIRNFIGSNAGTSTIANAQFPIVPTDGETYIVDGISYPVMGKLYVPTGLPASQIDVVVVFHGTITEGGTTTIGQAAADSLDVFLDQNNLNVRDKIIFSVAYPQDHISNTRQFNLSGVGTETSTFLMGDNLRYARAAVGWVKDSLNAFIVEQGGSKTIGDVYLFGHSQGGKLVSKMNTIETGISGVVANAPGPIQFDQTCAGGGSSSTSCTKISSFITAYGPSLTANGTNSATVTLTTTNVPDGTEIPYIITSKYKGIGIDRNIDNGVYGAYDSTNTYTLPITGLEFGDGDATGSTGKEKRHKINISSASTPTWIDDPAGYSFYDYSGSIDPDIAPAGAVNITVTAPTTAAYVMTGSDRVDSNFSTSNGTIVANYGDTIEFTINSGASHPFYVKYTTANGGTNDQVTAGVTNQGATSGSVIIDTTIIEDSSGNTLGGFFDDLIVYYQCSSHSSMRGMIIIRNRTYPTSFNTDVETGKFTGSADDGYWKFTLPWSVPIFGTNRSDVFISTNGVLSFGSGTLSYNNFTTISFDRLLLSACDGSADNVLHWIGGVAPNRFAFIDVFPSTNRFRQAPYSWYQIWFYENDPNHIYVSVQENGNFFQSTEYYPWDQSKILGGLNTTGVFTVNNNTATLTITPDASYTNPPDGAMNVNVRLGMYNTPDVDFTVTS